MTDRAPSGAYKSWSGNELLVKEVAFICGVYHSKWKINSVCSFYVILTISFRPEIIRLAMIPLKYFYPRPFKIAMWPGKEEASNRVWYVFIKYNLRLQSMGVTEYYSVKLKHLVETTLISCDSYRWKHQGCRGQSFFQTKVCKLLLRHY